MRILLIDDEKDILDMLGEFLSLFNVEVDIAFSGNEGVQYLKQKQYDAVITDVKMEHGDGMYVLEQIVEHKIKVDKIIVMTGYSQYKPDTFLEKGAYKVLQKPLETNDLKVFLGL